MKNTFQVVSIFLDSLVIEDPQHLLNGEFETRLQAIWKRARPSYCTSAFTSMTDHQEQETSTFLNESLLHGIDLCQGGSWFLFCQNPQSFLEFKKNDENLMKKIK